jgi:hypothetical protein
MPYDQEADVNLFHSVFNAFDEDTSDDNNSNDLERFWQPLPLWYSSKVDAQTVRDYFISHFAHPIVFDHFGSLILHKSDDGFTWFPRAQYVIVPTQFPQTSKGFYGIVAQS